MEDTEQMVLDALAQVGIAVDLHRASADDGVDMWFEPGHVAVRIKRWSLVSDDVARRAIVESDRWPESLLLVVGDRVTRDARARLTDAGVGYLDLRGRLALRTEHIVIDVEVQPLVEGQEQHDALNGKVGMEVATWLLMNPGSGARVRELERQLNRSASAISVVLRALRRDGLVSRRHTVDDDHLFLRVAQRWPSRWTWLSEAPPPGQYSRITEPLRLGLVDPETSTGWAMGGAAAAAAYGAPVAVRTDEVVHLYVPDATVLNRAGRLLGRVQSRAEARCAVQVAPVPWVCQRRVDLTTNAFAWPLAHPVFVALDLAGDRGRGREVLDAWTPKAPWSRVW